MRRRGEETTEKVCEVKGGTGGKVKQKQCKWENRRQQGRKRGLHVLGEWRDKEGVY